MNTMLKAISIVFASTMLVTIVIFQQMSLLQVALQLGLATAWLTVYVSCEHQEIGVIKNEI